jgi:hypothetical protein
MDFSNFISGGCAGAGGILCTQPIDTSNYNEKNSFSLFLFFLFVS